MDDILGYIAEDSPDAALHVLEAVEATTESLAELAERGRIVPEIEDRAIREVFAFRYRILYQVSSDQVRILAVIHGAMDYASRLKDID